MICIYVCVDLETALVRLAPAGAAGEAEKGVK